MTLADDMALVLEPTSDATHEARRRAAAQRIADFARTLDPIGFPLAPWVDWDRLRVNVAHFVAPSLVTWT